MYIVCTFERSVLTVHVYCTCAKLKLIDKDYWETFDLTAAPDKSFPSGNNKKSS